MSWLTTPLRHAAASPYVSLALRGAALFAMPAAVAVWLGAIGVTFVPRLGMSPPVASALALSIAAACTWSLLVAPKSIPAGRLGGLWIAATFLLPLWGDCCTNLLVSALGSSSATDAGLFAITLLAWGPVVVAAWRLVHTLAVTFARERLFWSMTMITLLGWTLCGDLGLSLWWQGPVAAFLGAASLSVLQWLQIGRSSRSEIASHDLAVAAPSLVTMPPVNSNSLATASSGLGLILCGLLWPSLERMVDQLVPATIHVVIASLVALAAGVMIGRLLLARRPEWALATTLTCGAVLSAWIGLFQLSAEVAGWATSTLSQTSPLFAFRMAVAAVPALIIGIAASGWASQFSIPAIVPWLFAAGVVAARGAIPVVSTPALVMTGLVVWGVSAAGLLFAGQSSFRGFARRPVRLATVAMLLALTISAPWMVAKYRPSETARTLFSTAIFEGRRSGLSGVELLALDEGRLIQAYEGVTGTFVAHRHGGSQWQLRRNGLPLGAFSTDVAAFPNFSGDVLFAAIPLAIHAQPERVLITGLTTSVPLSTALAFPLLAADCVEPDAALVDMHRGPVARERGESPLADERVRVRVADPLWAIRSARETYDVILSDPAYPVLAAAAADHSAEFYRYAAGRLARGGVFAQRIRSVDLGPQALTNLISTAQNEFSAVMLFDMAPGEVLLVATSSPEGLIREGLVSRLQAGHLRQCLASCGMDWSMLLNLAAWSPDGLMAMLATRRPDPSTMASPGLLFAMPNEAYAWTPKQQRLAALFTPHQTRLASLCGEDGNSPEVVRRLAEVTARQDLMIKYGDEFWAYRKAVKEQVTHKSRTLMKDKSGKLGDTLHDEDRRRIQYFQSLKKALELKTDESLARLESFERPYDPLLSFFVHAEAAEIASRLAPRQPARELRHRLHTIYFAPPATRSVRSVVESLRLVIEQPSATPEPQRRWELQSALLSALSARWATRHEVTPNASPQLLSDLDTSLLLTKRTLDEMERTRGEAGIPEAEWTSRRRVLNRTLVSRLEHFRQMAKLRTAPPSAEPSRPSPDSTIPSLTPPLAN